MASKLLYNLTIKAFVQDATNQITKASNFKKYAEALAKDIKKRTRLGNGNRVEGGTKQKLKKLSSKYVEQRKSFEGLSGDTSPGKSNLTLTGQMLDHIEVDSVSNGKANISVVGNRSEGGPSNYDVAVFVTDNGRPFLNPTKVEIKRIVDMMTEDILNYLRT